ncbi:hypothetical protein QYE76_029327 [Lolium multiflorum]|uniref:Trichome birefringence-like N-terminal domain-containing protein n=1 Tax=Lolium multiflorum TaxID=4521 RepID=A0AAD8QQY3_LOLMU|nr:hypothetical protein QYE76_029327 [Lolium multiflorum]
MKQLDGIAIPYWQYVFPAAVLTTCLVILAAVSLPGRAPLILPAATSRTQGPGGNRSSCNIFKGDWVPDHGAPSYTNETCPVIHGHYDCMRYGKPDLEFLRWRWQPEGCTRSCLLSRAERPVPWTNGGYLYRYERHGFTVADFWSPFLVRAAETDPDGPARNGAGLWSLHLDEPDPGWAAHVSKFDVVVVSAGSWFYRPSVFYERGRVVGCSGCLAPNVTDLTLRYSLRAAFRSALRAAVGASSGTGTVVVRTVSPAHYENGTWNDNGDCVRTRPLRRGEWEMERLQKEMRRIQVEEFAAAEVAARGKGVRMLLMDATEAMAMRPDAHPGKYRLWQPDKFRVSRDCVHWCLPGAMDVCNDMLLHMLID